MKKQEFINLISFCILMENNAGILSKAPRYVLEKWETKHPALLDEFNLRKLKSYEDRWNMHIIDIED